MDDERKAAPDVERFDDELSFDEAEALGFDGTGRDLDPRFPLRLSNLTPQERVLLGEARWARAVKAVDRLAALEVSDPGVENVDARTEAGFEAVTALQMIVEVWREVRGAH